MRTAAVAPMVAACWVSWLIIEGHRFPSERGEVAVERPGEGLRAHLFCSRERRARSKGLMRPGIDRKGCYLTRKAANCRPLRIGGILVGVSD